MGESDIYSSDSEEEKVADESVQPDPEKDEYSLIINVEGKPLYVKLDIFVKLCEFTCLKNRNFYSDRYY